MVWQNGLQIIGSTLDGYRESLIDAGLSRVPLEDDHKKRPSYHGTVESHVQLLGQARAVLKAMSSDRRIQNASAPTLFHPDLHKGNIFVSDENPSAITNIIDWQSASTEPAFWYANDIPDFAGITTEASEDEKEHKNEEICNATFEVCMKNLLPKIGHPRSLDWNIFRPFSICHNTWKQGAVSLQHDLIESSKDWQEHLGFTGSSTYQPTAEELEKHGKEYEFFKDIRGLEMDLQDSLFVSSDGWVPAENYETAMEMQKDLFRQFLDMLLKGEDADPDDPVMDEEDVRAIWPYDV